MTTKASSESRYTIPQRHVTFHLPELVRNNPWGFGQLVPAHPGIGQIDHSTHILANVLSFLDGDAGIPISMLRRAGSDLRVWDSNGEPQNVDSTSVGLHRDLAHILADDGRLQRAIDQLQFQGLVTCGYENVLRMHAGTRAMYKQTLDTVYWSLQSVVLVCHAFPRDEFLEPEFGDLGRAQITQVQHVLQHYDSLETSGQLSVYAKKEMVPTLIASSKFSTLHWKRKALERAQKLLINDAHAFDAYLEVMIKARQSQLHRLIGSKEKPDDVSRNFETAMRDKRLNAFLGEVHLGDAGMHSDSADLEKAIGVLHEIQPLDRDDISTLEELVLQKKALLWGKIRRYQGRFLEAREILEAMYNSSYPEGVVSVSASNYDLIAHLAAVLCELDEPYEAERLLSHKIDSVQSSGLRRSNRILRLKLAVAEAVLQQGEYWRAQDIYLDLNQCISVSSGRPESTMSACRLSMGLARVQHMQKNWAGALKYWEQALGLYKKVPASQGSGLAVVFFSIAYAERQLGNVERAAASEHDGQEMLKATGRQHWFTCLGTEWLDHVMPGSSQQAV